MMHEYLNQTGLRKPGTPQLEGQSCPNAKGPQGAGPALDRLATACKETHGPGADRPGHSELVIMDNALLSIEGGTNGHAHREPGQPSRLP